MGLASNAVFKTVVEHADQMLAFGRDPSSEDPSPLFASVVDPTARRATTYQLVPPPGVRLGDFSWAGNNLMHDIPFLETLVALTTLTGNRSYEEAVDRVFAYYGAHCPHPVTGLFPWGEHAQWSFAGRRVIPNCFYRDPTLYDETEVLIHDHLRSAPAWFWERMWAETPEAVLRFARGLDLHIMNPETMEHNRHAPLAGKHWNPIPYTGPGKDFARHAGFFIMVNLFAFRKSGEQARFDWARRKLDYHLQHRHPNGVLTGCVRTPSEKGEGQHDSFACSLHDAALAIGVETVEGRQFIDAARELFEARRNAPAPAPAVDSPAAYESAWTWNYGAPKGPPASGVPAQAYERCGIQWYADRIVHAAEWVLALPPPPDDRPYLAFAMAAHLQRAIDGYVVTGEDRFLEKALEIAGWAMQRCAPTGLVLGAMNIDYHFSINGSYTVCGSGERRSERPGYYFSGTGAPNLVRHLLRLALLQEGEEDILGADSHSR